MPDLTLKEVECQISIMSEPQIGKRSPERAHALALLRQLRDAMRALEPMPCGHPKASVRSSGHDAGATNCCGWCEAVAECGELRKRIAALQIGHDKAIRECERLKKENDTLQRRFTEDWNSTAGHGHL